MDLVATIIDIIQAMSVIIAAVTAVWGLTTWRREMIARKKADLAEAALVLFYEIRDIIRWARLPTRFRGEGTTRPRSENEAMDAAEYLDSVYIPIERLNKEHQIFARLESSKYRFMAVFGQEHAKAFDRMKEIRSRIIFAANMLGESPRDREENNRREWERTIGRGIVGDDAVANEVEEIVDEIERTCRPRPCGRRRVDFTDGGKKCRLFRWEQVSGRATGLDTPQGLRRWPQC